MKEVRELYRRSVFRCFLMSIGLNLFIELLARRDIGNLLGYIVYSPLVFLHNIMIVMVTLLFGFFFKKRYFAYGVISAVWVIAGIVNGVLLGFHIRTTPLTAQDLGMIRSAISLAGKYLSFWVIVLGILAVGILIAALVLLWKKTSRQEGKIHYVGVAVGITLSIFFVLCINDLGVKTGFLASNFSNIGQAYETYGFAYCFSNSLLNTGIDRPKDYEKDTVDKILESDDADDDFSNPADSSESADVQDESLNPDDSETGPALDETESASSEPEEQEPDPRPNIIIVQLESFFDITNMKNLTFSQDPIPTMHRLQEQYSSGYVSVPSIGAGTANTEFEMITGMNLDFFGPGEYPYKTVLRKMTCESVAYNMKKIGYQTHAIHNNNATFYERVLVFPRLGFDTFTSIEYMYDLEYTPLEWAKDKVLTGEILKAMNSTEDPDLIYTISVQGHGSYPEEALLEDPVITVTGLEEEKVKNAYTYYVNQIYEMDCFIAELVNALQEQEEPCVLVLFGDHLPTLGITEEDLEGADLFQTPYVIWDNMGLVRKERNVQAYQMAAWVQEQLGLHEGILTRFHQRFLKQSETEGEPESEEALSSSVSGEDQWFSSDRFKALFSDSSKDDAEQTPEEIYLEQLEVLEYDMLYGDMTVYGGTNPYKETNMQMGVEPIEIEEYIYNNGNLYVLGDGFNEYSKVMLNGKEQETEYLGKNLMIAREVKLGDQNWITVAQIDKDGVMLSESVSMAIRDIVGSGK